MNLQPLLRAHAFMQVQQPPELWEPETEDVRFVPLLGELIAAALSGGGELSQLALGAANIEVAEDGPVSAGQYVVVTISGSTDLGADSRWTADRPPDGLLGRIHDQLMSAGALFAYV